MSSVNNNAAAAAARPEGNVLAELVEREALQKNMN